ncbi:hypothetical protein BCR42DRAFT_414900 [Absidia repens]|uniref:Uncharacterized protein n=1 Tax=Absidia repens TaxID=90262 RepID=A0A1X2IH14_9FUNG|nr:hypothetical protein BCR42DRAFT_414900 [Absidia repens]
MLGKPQGIIKYHQTSSPPTIRTIQDSDTNPPKLKKKVQLNKMIQFMDDDGSCDMVLESSPDLEKLDSEDDYVGDGDSDNENDSDQSIQDGDGVEDINTDEDGSDYVDRDESSDEGEDDMELDEDDFGPLQYRDPKDKEFLLGFELRHFELDNDSGLDNINLRHEETTHEDTSLNDNLAFGLINALLNSSDKADKRKGKQLLSKWAHTKGKTMLGVCIFTNVVSI